ncbi:uncharacterized protein LOC129585732 [Paramacrobiotus metropolitanus]|uniref:uncharacterized protein LOC129585732 n=1 Tax=Paramacrobiotus metropolitanus TaxID=2943436 RepID=UPI002446319F|nr:uncharacterized protein LOC129585732 [Paramacrobiotus metropolitanus]XP_055334520.1 uncharacterized protein LOC129585732 [Paramacrobiotus metropolitanus]XP_055334521.1 uncharacterized protein LOC129585732 [Paramacrobiotus metropolitanus]XP_055334522.1 uncharacterized protein LOC129585732 [Paramacrobiotus metropolitanus]XP_055334523.1 uncharacterized protein LOC129585732 [Paramacrobiotus metropolitanus]
MVSTSVSGTQSSSVQLSDQFALTSSTRDRTSGADRSDQQTQSATVGIASRLVNQEQNQTYPLRFHDTLSGPRILLAPHQFGHIPLGYTVIPQPCAPFLPTGIAAQALPVFPGISSVSGIRPAHISAFETASIFAPYFAHAAPMHSDAMGISGAESGFQYPLHHLTGAVGGFGSLGTTHNMVPAFRVRAKEKSTVILSAENIEHGVSSSSMTAESSHARATHFDATEEIASEGKVLPVHIFDTDTDAPVYSPEEASNNPANTSSDARLQLRTPKRPAIPNKAGAKRHRESRRMRSSGQSTGTHNASPIVSILQVSKNTETEMQRAAKEWSADSNHKEPDCWDFLQRFKENQRKMDTLYVETRSVISSLSAEQRNEINFPIPSSVPKHVLQSVSIKNKDQPKVDAFETIIESATVDTEELRQFAKTLTQTFTLDIGPQNIDEEMAILSAVGLAEKTSAGNTPKVTKAIKVMNKMRNKHTETRKRFRSDSSARQNVRRELDEALAQLTSQLASLKRKVNAVKRLMKDEIHLSDTEIPNISKELQRALSAE